MTLPGLFDPITIGCLVALLALALRGLALYRAALDREAIGDHELLGRMSRPVGFARRATGACLTAAGAGLLAAALAAGGFGGDDSADDATGFETVIVMDASNSMLAEDVAPSRLRLEQALARRMAGQLAGRIGVVYFAGSGYVLSPLTEDRAATLMFTESVHPTHVGRGGTSMVDGLEQALVVLAGGRPEAVRSIVLFSDGENTVDETAVSLVVERARRSGIAIHAVGLGTVEGGRIPMPRAQPMPGVRTDSASDGAGGPAQEPSGTAGEPDAERRWLRDNTGRIVVTRLDEASLRAVAASTGGLYVTGPTGADALLERMPAGGARPPVSTAAFNGLLLAAFLVLAFEAFVVRHA